MGVWGLERGSWFGTKGRTEREQGQGGGWGSPGRKCPAATDRQHTKSISLRLDIIPA